MAPRALPESRHVEPQRLACPLLQSVLKIAGQLGQPRLRSHTARFQPDLSRSYPIPLSGGIFLAGIANFPLRLCQRMSESDKHFPVLLELRTAYFSRRVPGRQLKLLSKVRISPTPDSKAISRIK
jgi:hypothetical protein